MNQTDTKVLEISKKIEVFILKNKNIIIISILFFLGLVGYLLFGQEKIDKNELESRLVEYDYEIKKTQSFELFEGSKRIAKAGVKGLKKEYFRENEKGEEEVLITERDCEECKVPETQEEEEGAFSVKQGVVDSKDVLLKFLQAIKIDDSSKFEKYTGDDYEENTSAGEVRKLREKYGIFVKDYTIESEDGKPDLERTDMMVVKFRVNFILNNGDIGEYNVNSREVLLGYNINQKKWFVLWPFYTKGYSLKNVDGMIDYQIVDGSINSSRVRVAVKGLEYIKSLYSDELLKLAFQTDTLFDKYKVTISLRYKETKEGETKEIELDSKTISTRRAGQTKESVFNNSFGFQDLEGGGKYLLSYVSVPKFKLKEDDIFESIHFQITPGIDDVNPYLKFPTLNIFLDKEGIARDNSYDYNSKR